MPQLVAERRLQLRIGSVRSETPTVFMVGLNPSSSSFSVCRLIEADGKQCWIMAAS